MEIINYTEARSNLSHIMDLATESHVPVAITRQKGKPVVMISLEDYNGWNETLYLNSSEANRKRLLKSIENVEAGLKKSEFHKLKISDLEE